jgi:hypothetical protein
LLYECVIRIFKSRRIREKESVSRFEEVKNAYKILASQPD